MSARSRARGRVPVLCACVLLAALLLSHGADGERLRQFPFFDVDGWSCHGRGCGALRALHGSLVGQDADETTWFFAAPPHVLGDLACASTASFRITHPEVWRCALLCSPCASHRHARWPDCCAVPCGAGNAV